MGFLVKYIGGFTSADLFSLHGNTFVDTPFVPVDTTFTEVTIQSAPSFDHSPNLEPGASRTVQMMKGTAGTGTVNASGSSVVGTGTLFLTQLAPGSFIKINGGPGTGVSTHRVATISDNTHLTVEDSIFPSVTGGTFVAINLTGSAVTLSGPDSQATGSLGGVLIPAPAEGPANAVAYFLVTRAGDLDPFDQRMVVKFTIDGNRSIWGIKISDQFSYSFTPPPNSDYHNFTGNQSLTETDVQMYWPEDGTFSNLVVRLTDFGFASATEHVEVFLRINGADTTLGLSDATLPQGGDVIHRNDIDTASVNAGDLVTIRVKITAGGASEEELFAGSAYIVFEPTP